MSEQPRRRSVSLDRLIDRRTRTRTHLEVLIVQQAGVALDAVAVLLDALHKAPQRPVDGAGGQHQLVELGVPALMMEGQTEEGGWMDDWMDAWIRACMHVLRV